MERSAVKQEWYRKSDHALVCATGSDDEVVVRQYESDFFPRVIVREHWQSYTDKQRAAVVGRVTAGMKRIASLGDVTVIAYTGPQTGDPHEYQDTKVWLPGDPELGTSWALAGTHGRQMLVKEVLSGTQLMGRGAPRLFAKLHGGLCIDPKSEIFLGDWREAVQVHITRMRDNMRRLPRIHKTKEAALHQYLAQRTIGWVGTLRLAYSFLGLKRALAVCDADPSFRFFRTFHHNEYDQMVAAFQKEEAVKEGSEVVVES
jgi:hypothetical protein